MANVLKYLKLNDDPRLFREETTIKPKLVNLKKKVNESTGLHTPEFIIPKIEAIHAGLTRNHTYYPATELKGDPTKGTGVHSWITPYPKPVIYNHDTDTDATGRVIKAIYTENTQAGRPGIVLYPRITCPEAIRAIRDGRLLTVSIGGESQSVVCNICQTDIANEGFCGHMKGEVYDGQACNWVIRDLRFDEVSWVNVPADSDAMVVDTESSVFLDESESLQPKETKQKNKEIIVEFKGSLEKEHEHLIVNENQIREGDETLGKEELLKLAEMVVDLLKENKEATPATTEEKPVTEETPIVETSETTEEPIVVEEVPIVDEIETTDELVVEEESIIEETETTEETVATESAPVFDASETTNGDAVTKDTDLAEANQVIALLKEEVKTLTKQLKEANDKQKEIALEVVEALSFEDLHATLMVSEACKTSEGILSFIKKTQVATKETRSVASVKNPLGTQTGKLVDESTEPKELTAQDKINVFKKMLKD